LTAGALAALARGEVDRWRGLPAGTRFADVDVAFGDPGPGPNGVALMHGQPVVFRHYPPAAIATAGLTAYAEPPEEEAVVAIRIPSPLLAEAALAALGPAELELPSGLAPFHRQDVWLARGLALHRHSAEPDRVLSLAAFGPTTAEAYREWWLSQVEVGRRRR